MKINPVLIAMSLVVVLPLGAEDKTKTADPAKPADKTSTKAEGADAAWEEVDEETRGRLVDFWKPKDE